MAHIHTSSDRTYNRANSTSTMPRLVQPGGLSGKMRVRYTARRKLALLASVKRVMEEEGLTLRMAAERLRVAHSLFVKWEAQRSADGDPILAMLKSKRKANHPGPIGQLKPIEGALLRYIFEQREQGMAVTTFDLAVKRTQIALNVPKQQKGLYSASNTQVCSTFSSSRYIIYL